MSLLSLNRLADAELEMRDVVQQARLRLGETVPKTLLYQSTLAEILMADNRYREALQLLEHCSGYETKYRHTFLALMGVCHFELGDFEKARTHLNQSMPHVYGSLKETAERTLLKIGSNGNK